MVCELRVRGTGTAKRRSRQGPAAPGPHDQLWWFICVRVIGRNRPLIRRWLPWATPDLRTG